MKNTILVDYFSLEEELRFQYSELQYHVEQAILASKEVTYHEKKCVNCIFLLTEIAKKISAGAHNA